MDPYQLERDQMVDSQIMSRGIKDESVLAVMRKVPRHLLLPKDTWHQAYRDHPIRIGNGQTISQPYIVALMTELLAVEKNHKVLDVGTGSGYQAAILAELAQEVHTIERFHALAQTAEERLDKLGYENIHVHVGDGTKGYPPASPYDRIVVTAAAPQTPQALLDQLKDAGTLVIPVGSRHLQHLEVWHRKKDKFHHESNIPVVFVPLIGEEGWED
jgi:protein-L-isoaspartate(D-aspartate) O-methyltransferase